jgi:hypothetical protein
VDRVRNMKTKTQTNTVTHSAYTFKRYQNSNGALLYAYNGIPVLTTDTREITYGEQPRPLSNPCLHTELEVISYNVGGSYVLPLITWVVADGGLSKFWFCQRYVEARPQDILDMPSQDDMNEIIIKAWSAMKPSLAPVVALPNTIIEAREILQLGNIYRSAVSLIRNLFGSKRSSRGVSQGLRRRAKQASKDISDGHLNIAFGWLPLYRDILAAHKAIKNLASDLEALKAGSGKFHKRYHKTSLPAVVSSIEVNTPGDGITDYLKLNLEQTETLVTCTCYYRYNISKLDALLETTYALADRFGAGAFASTIWNAIPFSFVVDWFLDVGNWLQQFDGSLLPIKVTLHDFTVSVKLSGRLTVVNHFHSDYGVSPAPLGHVDMRYYERYVQHPYVSSLPLSIDALNAREFLLGASLINQRV